MRDMVERSGSELTIRIYYEDTDMGGVVYYANYLKFFERGRTEWLRSRGWNQQRLADSERLVFVVRHADIAYHAPARLDDVLSIETQATEIRAATLFFKQQARRQGELLAAATIQICAVHASSFKPMRFPPELRDSLNQASHLDHASF